ncbi:protein FAM210A-like [Macrotis lagotis]|uniref:protein FAM210A-like n=1 Tax=Macrotis lagotis TaxID=92651 RepID=UPI003D682373
MRQSLKTGNTGETDKTGLRTNDCIGKHEHKGGSKPPYSTCLGFVDNPLKYIFGWARALAPEPRSWAPSSRKHVLVRLLSVAAPASSARESLPCRCLRPRTLRAPRGMNIVPFLEHIGLPNSIVDILKNSQSGNALTAYTLFKIATPARYTVTLGVISHSCCLGGTSITVKYLRSHGYMSTPPLVKEYFQDKMEETKELISEKMGETKDRLTEKLQETKEKVSFKKKVE